MIANKDLIRTEVYIGGNRVKGNETFAVLNPATFEELGAVPDTGKCEAEKAIHKHFVAASVIARNILKSETKTQKKS